MKSTLIALFGMAFSISAFALEDGAYINNSYKRESAQMFKSVTTDTSKCENGGAIVKFYGADEMNFCVGNIEESSFKTTRCIGKELPYPFGYCVGVKKKFIIKRVRKTIVNEANGSIALLDTSYSDDKVTFTQLYQFTEEGENIRLNYSFSDKTDGRQGKDEILFEKIN